MFSISQLRKLEKKKEEKKEEEKKPKGEGLHATGMAIKPKITGHKPNRLPPCQWKNEKVMNILLPEQVRQKKCVKSRWCPLNAYKVLPNSSSRITHSALKVP